MALVAPSSPTIQHHRSHWSRKSGWSDKCKTSTIQTIWLSLWSISATEVRTTQLCLCMWMFIWNLEMEKVWELGWSWLGMDPGIDGNGGNWRQWSHYGSNRPRFKCYHTNILYRCLVPIDMANLWKAVNRIRNIMGEFGCTKIRTPNLLAPRGKNILEIYFLGSEYFAWGVYPAFSRKKSL